MFDSELKKINRALHPTKIGAFPHAKTFISRVLCKKLKINSACNLIREVKRKLNLFIPF